MLNAKDLELLAAKGISEKQIEEQLACFVRVGPEPGHCVQLKAVSLVDGIAGSVGNIVEP